MTPTPFAPEAAVRRFLDQWVRHEASLHDALQTTDPVALRSALQRTATFFRTVRNLRRSSDEAAGLPRLELLRRSFFAVKGRATSDVQFAATTIQLARAIGHHYGGRSYLSLASKLLWTKFRHPFLIYDSVVRRELGTANGDYLAYVSAWQSRYFEEAPSIRAACQHVAASNTHMFKALSLSPSEARRILRSEWFQRRVMDILLWKRGV
jgi:hypothetical protein